MPVLNVAQNSFTAGELGPLLRGRSDIASYYNGAAKIRNALVLPQGAVARRPGLAYRDTLPTTGAIKMVPFKYSAEYHYLIVLTALEARIYKEGVLIDTIVTAITEAQIPDISWAQSYSTLIIFHHEFAPKSLIRESDLVWTMGIWPLENIPTNAHYSWPESDMVLTYNNGDKIEFGDWIYGNVLANGKATAPGAFRSYHVGRYLRGTSGGFLKITSYINDNEVTVTILQPWFNDLSDGAARTYAGEWYFEEESWSDTYGWPSCGTFYQGRLWVANTPDRPNTIWGSIVNNETNFQNWLPNFDDNGMELTGSGGVQTGYHTLFSGKHLFILSDTGEYYVPVQTGKPITPTTGSIYKNSSLGARKLPSFEVEGSVVFLRSNGNALMELDYNFAKGGYEAENLSLLSSHLLKNPQALGYRKQTGTEDADYIIAVNEDGTVAILCTLRTQKVNAWTQSVSEGSAVTVGVDEEDIYFAMDRVIDGTPVRFLEHTSYDNLLDSGKSVYGSGFTVVDGLDHLEGETVKIVLDNTVQPDQVVVGGEVQLVRPGDFCSVGLPFPIVDEATGSHVYIETMPVESEDSKGTSIGRKKRLVEVTVMVQDTSHIIVNKNKVPVRLLGLNKLDSPVPRVSENIQVSGLLGWDDEIAVGVGQTLPLSMTLLGLAYKVRF